MKWEERLRPKKKTLDLDKVDIYSKLINAKFDCFSIITVITGFSDIIAH